MKDQDLEALERQYLAEIRNWNWEFIKREAQEYVEETEEGEKVGLVCIGSVTSICPSGKYWTWFACSNVTEEEQERDTLFMECLETVADEHGMWTESGEADPCDLFAGMNLDD